MESKKKIVKDGRFTFLGIREYLICHDPYYIDFLKYDTGEYEAYDSTFDIDVFADSKAELKEKVQDAVISCWKAYIEDKTQKDDAIVKELHRIFEKV